MLIPLIKAIKKVTVITNMHNNYNMPVNTGKTRHTEPLCYIAQLIIGLSCLVLWIRETSITVNDYDCINVEENNNTEVSLETKNALDMTITHGNLTPDDCIWLHDNHISWEVNVEK